MPSEVLQGRDSPAANGRAFRYALAAMQQCPTLLHRSAATAISQRGSASRGLASSPTVTLSTGISEMLGRSRWPSPVSPVLPLRVDAHGDQTGLESPRSRCEAALRGLVRESRHDSAFLEYESATSICVTLSANWRGFSDAQWRPPLPRTRGGGSDALRVRKAIPIRLPGLATLTPVDPPGSIRAVSPSGAVPMPTAPLTLSCQ